MPTSVKVGPWVYRVEEWHTHNASSVGRYGECEHATRTIRVDNSYGARQTAGTLMHELLHAIWGSWNIQDADGEERTVRSMGHGLVAVMVDNPGLATWFEAALSGGDR